jgi:hypothetical protein
MWLNRRGIDAYAMPSLGDPVEISIGIHPRQPDASVKKVFRAK